MDIPLELQLGETTREIRIDMYCVSNLNDD